MWLFRRPNLIITLIIMVFLTVLLVVCFSYDPATRAVPLLVISGGLILSVLLLAGEIFPQLAGKFEAGLFTSATEVGDKDSGQQTCTLDSRRNFIIVSAWIIMFFLLILLFGYLISIFLSIFLFLKLGRKIPWQKSLIISGASCVVVFFVFEKFMHLRLFKGIIFGGIIS